MNIQEILKNHGKRITPERIEIFGGFGDFHLFQANDLIEKFPHIGRASIFRTIELFLEVGVLRRLAFEGRGDYYELDTDHHHEHFECTRCRTIFHFDAGLLCKTLEILGRKQGFQITNHQMILSGLCSNCSH